MSAQTLRTSLADNSIQTVPKSTTQGWFACLALRLFSASVPQPSCWSQSHWQRSHRLRAVSESTPALRKPEVASKPQIKEASAGNKPEPAEQEPRYKDTAMRYICRGVHHSWLSLMPLVLQQPGDHSVSARASQGHAQIFQKPGIQ
jgi:hypothetical protein